MIFAALLIAGCGNKEEKKSLAEQLVGDWHSTSLTMSDAYTYSGEVYIGFSADNTFELYQKVGEGAFRRRTGTYTFDGTIIDGVYSDKTTWKEAKSVTVDGDVLVMVGVETGEAISYIRKLVPATVRHHYSDALKSVADYTAPWL